MNHDFKVTDIVLGLHNAYSPVLGQDKKTRAAFNSLTVAAWIPVIGIIAGIARLIFTAMLYKVEKRESDKGLTPHQKGFYAAMILRGVVETLSLGLFLIISDLIVTIGRNLAHQPTSKSIKFVAIKME